MLEVCIGVDVCLYMRLLINLQAPYIPESSW